MAVDPFRFLGLAFATADLLFEVDDKARVTFAAGAGQKLAGVDGAQLVGRPWLDLFAEADRPTAEALLGGLAEGERRSLAEIELVAGPDGAARRVSLSAFRLPQNAPRISCALTLAEGHGARRRAEAKLFERGEFEAAARAIIEGARASGPELELGLIELAGLASKRDGLSRSRRTLWTGVWRGRSAPSPMPTPPPTLANSGSPWCAAKGDTPEAMVRRLTQLLGPALQPRSRRWPSTGAGSVGRMMRAMKFALDGFIANGEPPAVASLSEVLNASVRQAVEDANAFGAVVDSRSSNWCSSRWSRWPTGEVRHYETLVRFKEGQSPFAMIRMAEELDVIEDLDRAVAEEALKRLRADRTGRAEAGGQRLRPHHRQHRLRPDHAGA